MTKHILTITIEEAIALANLYEDDPNWDLWDMDFWSF